VVTEAPRGTRRQILEAAEQVVNERGLRGATTRAIAQRAGCAEGTIFRYFPNMHHLFVEVVKGQFPEFTTLAQSLPERVGKGSVRKNLEELARVALAFHRAMIPVITGTMTERTLLEAQRRHWVEAGTGPLRVMSWVTDYVRGEQQLGRLSDRTPPEYVTRFLLGATFGQALLEQLVGEEAKMGGDGHFAKEVVRVTLEGLQPRAAG
jgi:AcrR family transcriptional regulator